MAENNGLDGRLRETEAKLNERLAENNATLAQLQGQYDAFKAIRPFTFTVTITVFGIVVGLLGAVTVGGFAVMQQQLNRLDTSIGRNDERREAQLARIDARLEALPQRISEEFRAVRAEMSAQTSAIANVITATRQVTPLQLPLQQAPPQQQLPFPPQPLPSGGSRGENQPPQIVGPTLPQSGGTMSGSTTGPGVKPDSGTGSSSTSGSYGTGGASSTGGTSR